MKPSELRTRTPRRLVTAKGMEVFTFLTDAECIATLRAGHDRLSSFGRDLLTQGSLRGLSPNQWPWAHKLALELLPASCNPSVALQQAPSVAPVQPAAHVDLAALRSLMETAQSKGIKHPKIGFTLDEGTLVIALAGAGSRAPGSIAVTSKGSFENRTYYGRIHTDGRWEAARGGAPAWVLVALTELAANPAGYGAAYGRRSGNCCFCSRDITTKESLHVGYGPICADKYGLPWGDTGEVAQVAAPVAPAAPQASQPVAAEQPVAPASQDEQYATMAEPADYQGFVPWEDLTPAERRYTVTGSWPQPKPYQRTAEDEAATQRAKESMKAARRASVAKRRSSKQAA